MVSNSNVTHPRENDNDACERGRIAGGSAAWVIADQLKITIFLVSGPLFGSFPKKIKDALSSLVTSPWPRRRYCPAPGCLGTS